MPRRGRQSDSYVFVNCPTDTAYRELLRPLLFTIVSLGYTPRLAIERSDSGENRLAKICEFIKTSKYSIHDLSRLQASKVGEFARMNMPLELGIDYGTRRHGPRAMRGKKFLILEKRRYAYHKALSDLSGVDIKSHGNDPTEIIRAARDWFVETVGVKRAPSATALWWRFYAFMEDFTEKRKAEGFSAKDRRTMPIREFVRFIKTWLAEHPNP